jgi:hypothetical protein
LRQGRAGIYVEAVLGAYGLSLACCIQNASVFEKGLAHAPELTSQRPHFLQIPGPTNVPDRILRAMDYPTIDHRGPEFNALAKKVLRSVRQVFQTKQPVIVYPASGTGAWEGAWSTRCRRVTWC